MQLTPQKYYKYKLDDQWYIGQLDDIGYLHPLAVSPEENGEFEPVTVLDPICTGEVDIIIAREVQSILYKNIPYLAPVSLRNLRGIDGVNFHGSILS
jgi:hypothetical protein